jgi:hypothetical protein
MAKKPSLGFKAGAMHRAASGHFCEEKYLRAGHNTSPNPTASRRSVLDRANNGPASPALAAKAAAIRAEHPVQAARSDKRAAVRTARIDARYFGGSQAAVKSARNIGRTKVAAAKLDPNSGLRERAAAGNAGAQRRVTNVYNRLRNVASVV